MNYDDWKLATPPDGDGINDELIECDICSNQVSPYAMNELLNKNICNNCLKKYLDE